MIFLSTVPPMPQTIPTAEPFFFPGNKTGVLLIHAFTSAPKEMRWMGEYLNRQGYTVLGIRLAGHATRPEDMLRCRWQDWLLSVEDGYNLLRACTQRIFLAGLSMGGMLGLVFASQFPAIGGVIAMSTPYSRPKDWRLKYIGILGRIKPYIPKGNGKPGSGWFSDAWKQHVAYPQYPVRAIGELSLLMDVMDTALPQVKVPVLLIYTRNDHPLLQESIDKIRAALGRAEKQTLWIEGSGHTITEEPKRQQVFEACADFIQQFSNMPGV